MNHEDKKRRTNMFKGVACLHKTPSFFATVIPSVKDVPVLHGEIFGKRQQNFVFMLTLILSDLRALAERSAMSLLVSRPTYVGQFSGVHSRPVRSNYGLRCRRS